MMQAGQQCERGERKKERTEESEGRRRKGQ